MDNANGSVVVEYGFDLPFSAFAQMNAMDDPLACSSWNLQVIIRKMCKKGPILKHQSLCVVFCPAFRVPPLESLLFPFSLRQHVYSLAS